MIKGRQRYHYVVIHDFTCQQLLMIIIMNPLLLILEPNQQINNYEPNPRLKKIKISILLIQKYYNYHNLFDAIFISS